MSSKIDELRARLKADPKGRHFFPLGEELRKSGALQEAADVLREGLKNHPNYLSAWTVLGRVQKDSGHYSDAIESLQRAFTLDGGNVVTARLLAESYLALGDKVEAIKKFKLVHALLPSDEELLEQIEALDRDLNPQNFAEPVVTPAAMPEVETPEESGAPLDTNDTAVREPRALAPVEEPDISEGSEQQTIAAPHSDVADEEVEAPFEEASEQQISGDDPSPDAADENVEAPFEAASFEAPEPQFDEVADEPRLPTMEQPFATDARAEDDGGAFEPEALFHGRDESASVQSPDAAARRQAMMERLEGWLMRVKR